MNDAMILCMIGKRIEQETARMAMHRMGVTADILNDPNNHDLVTKYAELRRELTTKAEVNLVNVLTGMALMDLDDGPESPVPHDVI